MAGAGPHAPNAAADSRRSRGAVSLRHQRLRLRALREQPDRGAEICSPAAVALQHPRHESLLAAVLLATAVRRGRRRTAPSRMPRIRRGPKPRQRRSPRHPAAEAFFKPSETRSTGTVTVGGQPIAFDAIAGTLVVHAKDWEDTDAVEADADADSKSDKDKNAPKPEASMFYTAYFKQGAPAAARPITFVFNGGPGSSSIWLHMGAFGPVRVRHHRHQAHARALLDRQQRPEPARRVRPRVHRRARHRLLAHRRQGQGKGVLRSRPGHRRLHPFHHPVPDQIRPLELAQICVRRKLWDDARRRPVARAAEGRRRFERRDAAVGHPQLGLHARRPAAQPGHRHAVHRRASDLCGDRLVLQQGAAQAGGPPRVPEPGRAVRDRRLRAGAAQG